MCVSLGIVQDAIVLHIPIVERDQLVLAALPVNLCQEHHSTDLQYRSDRDRQQDPNDPNR